VRHILNEFPKAKTAKIVRSLLELANTYSLSY